MPELSAAGCGEAGGGAQTSGPGRTRSPPDRLASGQIKAEENMCRCYGRCVSRVSPASQRALVCPMPAGDLHNGDERRLREPL